MEERGGDNYSFPEIMALKCSGVRGRTEVELGIFLLLCMNSSNYGSFVRILGLGAHRVGSGFFKCSEWGKIRYLVMLELMPPQALSLVKMVVAESIVEYFAFRSL